VSDRLIHLVPRGVCVVKTRAIAILLGAVVASSLSTPARFAGSADAADAVPPRPLQAAKVPEFVPVINFSEFVMAMQTFAAENPPAARAAAETLSAKFAANIEAGKIGLPAAPAPQQALAAPVPQQVAAVPAAKTAPAPAIAARPVVAVAEVPVVPDPAGQQPQVADPVKIVTGYHARRADAAPRRRKADKNVIATSTSTSRSRVERHFEPAMGLGMEIESAEDAPPMSELSQKKRKLTSGSAGIE
jgi:hypothetical protein